MSLESEEVVYAIYIGKTASKDTSPCHLESYDYAGRIWIASSLLTMGQLEVDKTIELG